ncbi:DUF4270 domain-containing protein [Leptobacterium sp. I13]|uniref:DUF4270 domain-containing protein n=1 Tax=Leptobacterium meishanense TaxID=3128904 RepID=UPI0030ED55EE
MRILRKSVIRVFLLVCFAAVMYSCDEDFNTIGIDVVGNSNFETDKVVFDVYAQTKTLTSVRTDGLPLYQLGRLNNPIYGTREARIVTQAFLQPPNPVFGSRSQTLEDVHATDDDEETIPENETVKKVYLNVPFFNSAPEDADGDGVPDDIDVDPDNPESDTDEDGVTDFDESRNGTDPLNPDTDGDGIGDAEDTDTASDIVPEIFKLDSIYGNKEAVFNVRVDELTFFLRDLDPSSNFEEAQEYFSSADFSGSIGQNLYDGVFQINNIETLIFNEDDPNTDADESTTVLERVPPGIRVELNPQFFQEKILDKEGANELATNNNFKDFFRGVIISTDNFSEDILMLLDFAKANITIDYEYDRLDTNGTSGNTSDDTIIKERDTYRILLSNTILNSINTMISDLLPGDITAEIAKGINASRLYLNGGSGSFVEINLFDPEGVTEKLEEVRANDWLINEANLTFYIDRAVMNSSSSIIEPKRLYLYNLTNGTTLIDYEIDFSQGPDPNGSRSNYGGIIQTDDDGKGIKYKIRLTEHINRVLRKDSTNVKLGLVVTSDINNPVNVTGIIENMEEVPIPQASVINPFGTVLFGGNATTPEEEEKKLRLEIFYTDPTNDN